jgi:hypothetical protein
VRGDHCSEGDLWSMIFLDLPFCTASRLHSMYAVFCVCRVSEKWYCRACTFENTVADPKCSMCEAARPAAPAPAPVPLDPSLSGFASDLSRIGSRGGVNLPNIRLNQPCASTLFSVAQEGAEAQPVAVVAALPRAQIDQMILF